MTRRSLRADLRHLDQLAALGPCDPPETVTANDWADPVWLARWLRSHPDELDRARRAIAAVIDRPSLAEWDKHLAASTDLDALAAENARLAARQRTIDNLKEHTP